MLPRFSCATEKSKEKAVILVFVVGMLIVVLVLAMAMIMLSVSQDFLTHAQKEDLKGFYVAEAQIQWAAMKLREYPHTYSGGTSEPNIYIPEDPEAKEEYENIEYIEIDVEGDDNVGELEGATWSIKAYVRFKEKEALGKKQTAARIDANLVKRVTDIAGGKEIAYTIEDWQEIRPPEEP